MTLVPAFVVPLREYISHTRGDDSLTTIFPNRVRDDPVVTQITQNRVVRHEKHVVHLIYKTRGLEKVTDAKLIDNLIVQLFN